MFNRTKKVVAGVVLGGLLFIGYTSTVSATEKSGYDSNSIVDYLHSQGEDHSFDYRSSLAQDQGIENYKGTAEQNISLLALLRDGETINVNNVPDKHKVEDVQEAPTEESTKEVAKEESKTGQANNQKVSGKTLTVEATFYTAGCHGCTGITANGTDLNANPHAKVIAAPSSIPLGTKVYIEGYGEYTVADRGGDIGFGRIDIHVPTKEEAIQRGRQTLQMTILD